MNKPAHFSIHAFERIAQRTKLSCFDIANILDRRQCVLLGSKPGLSKEYVLFYSQPDDAYFVALQDIIDGTVITVLPLEYHENLAWGVTQNQKNTARNLAAVIQCADEKQPSKFIVAAGYISNDGTLKVKDLKKFEVEIYGEDMMSFVGSHLDKFELTQMASGKSIDYIAIEWFSIRRGRDGARVSLSPPGKRA